MQHHRHRGVYKTKQKPIGKRVVQFSRIFTIYYNVVGNQLDNFANCQMFWNVANKSYDCMQ